MDTFLSKLKEDVLLYADEPSDSVKYSENWLYRQIGREAANLYQQAVAQHHLLGKSSMEYVVTDGQSRFFLPGNFQKLIALFGLTAEGLMFTTWPAATDGDQAGVTLLGPYEFELHPAPVAGSRLRLLYQRKALTDLFYGTVSDSSTDGQAVLAWTGLSGMANRAPGYYAGSYLRVTGSSEVGLIGQIRRISGSAATAETLTLTLDSVLPAALPAGSTVEILPEVPAEHWDAVAWAVVRKMRNASRDREAVTQVIMEYKEARHWYLQAMAALQGRSGNQFVGDYPWSGNDEVWN